jgi:hypothetical protein
MRFWILDFEFWIVQRAVLEIGGIKWAALIAAAIRESKIAGAKRQAMKIQNPKSGLFFFFHLDNNAPAVVAALRANAVRYARLAAVRAGARVGRRQVVVRAALAGA